VSTHLQAWHQLLKAVEPQGPATPHSWICETYREGQGRQCEVLSEEEYRNLSSKNSWWKTYCEKFSLDKIIAVVRDEMNELPSTSPFLMCVLKGDTFSADFDADKLLAQFDLETTAFPRTVAILDKMCQRSTAKHTALKTRGFWDKIKFLMWSWFHDKSPIIESLKNRALSLKASLTKEKAYDEIRERIFTNIESFEYAAARVDARWERIIDEKEYQSPKDIQKWIMKYSADRYHPESGQEQFLDAIDRSRKRILVLYQLWSKLIAYEPESDLRPPAEQTLLLAGPQENMPLNGADKR
jgi:hypothetical protein